MNTSALMARPMITLSAFRSLEESDTLFDFDSPVNQDNFVINSTSHIYRKKFSQNFRGKKLKVISKQDAMNGDLPDFNFEMIFSLRVKQEDRQITYALGQPQTFLSPKQLTLQNLKNLPYLCLNNHGRKNEVKSCLIKDGDIIKLGKTYLKVLQTHLGRRENTQIPSYNNLAVGDCWDGVGEVNDRVCRICLMEGDGDQDLISPCNCKGSCRYVHLSCLKIWLQNKINRQHNRFVSIYNLAKFQCQLCKTSLSNHLIVRGKNEQLIQFHKPDEPYIVLELLQEEQNKNKSLYVLTPKDHGVRVGRGNLAELHFNDPALSRMHAVIQFRQGVFTLTDMGSKFGSHLLLHQQKEFKQIVCVQICNKMYKLEAVPSVYPRGSIYL